MSITHVPHVSFQHCERHIQSLQTRVLELQQQLAVAVAADHKKDLMIEQLDKVTVAIIGRRVSLWRALLQCHWGWRWGWQALISSSFVL